MNYNQVGENRISSVFEGLRSDVVSGFHSAAVPRILITVFENSPVCVCGCVCVMEQNRIE